MLLQWSNMTGSGVSLRAFRDLPILLQSLQHRAVAFGVFRFLWAVFRSKRVDFELNLETMKPYCIVMNELVTLNPFIRPAILSLTTELLSSTVEGMEDLSQVCPPQKPSKLYYLLHLLKLMSFSVGVQADAGWTVGAFSDVWLCNPHNPNDA